MRKRKPMDILAAVICIAVLAFYFSAASINP